MTHDKALIKFGNGRKYFLRRGTLDFDDLKEYEIAPHYEPDGFYLRPFPGDGYSCFFPASDIIVNPTPQDWEEQRAMARNGIEAFEKVKADFIQKQSAP